METNDKAKAVLLAQDAIKHIDSKKIIPEAGNYVGLPSYWENPNDNAKTFLSKQGSCEACALGALFVSHILRFNNITTGKAFSYGAGSTQSNCTKGLQTVFTEEQLGLIESAFECSDTYAKYAGCSEDISKKTALLYWDLNDEERLIAICQNIIDNDGEFVVNG